MIDNALGSGLVETAGHLAFLPGLRRELLAEELLFPRSPRGGAGRKSLVATCSSI